jgi:Kef-type K+ transport system membrane component KefB
MNFLFGSAETEQAARALRTLHVEDVLLPVLCQLAVILLTARIFFVLFRKLGQPGVVGEIAAGLVLGPSVLGLLFPGLFKALFEPTVADADPQLVQATLLWVFQILAQLGLIFLLFLIGLEFDFTHLKSAGTAATAISATGIAVPFVLGLALAWFIHPLIEPQPDNSELAINKLSFSLFMGTALAITAIPVLGRIMVELGIQRTRLGAITIASAAIDDAIGWILLATVTAVVHGGIEIWGTLWMIALTVIFAATMIFVARPLLVRWARWTMRHGNGELTINHLAALLVIVLLTSIATNVIGIFAIFGSFLLGAVLSGEQQFHEAVVRRLRDFVTVFFLPIFFTYTGLRTNIVTISSLELWIVAGVVLLFSIVGKLGGCGLAAWLSGFKPREAACIGVMMNTRGLMALIVVDVGYRLQVIPQSVYCMLVLMSLLTTVMTTPLLLRLMCGTELEQHVRQSGFMRGR